MPFPDTERIIYMNNPLAEVICQFRFPPILSIDSDLPARFQDSIRDTYPLFQEKVESSISIPDEMVSQIPQEIISMFPSHGSRKNYEFISEDEQWKINLTRTFIALTSYRYTRWEEFLNYFIISFDALLENYSPKSFTRIGLRYKDLIDKSELNLGETHWNELLQPHIAGILSDPATAQNVTGTSTKTEMILSDGESIVRISHGLVNAKGHNDVCYLIDSDFYTNHKTSVDQAIEKLAYFNKRGTRLIRWCITDTLHDALGPEII